MVAKEYKIHKKKGRTEMVLPLVQMLGWDPVAP
jgi:hypothetical protein